MTCISYTFVQRNIELMRLLMQRKISKPDFSLILVLHCSIRLNHHHKNEMTSDIDEVTVFVLVCSNTDKFF